MHMLETIKHISRGITHEALGFFMALAVLAPWSVISYTAGTANFVLIEAREGVVSYAYAESYSSVTTSATSNGVTVVKTSSSSGTTSSSASVTTVMNGADGEGGEDGARGQDGEDGRDGISAEDGISFNTTADTNEKRLALMKTLIEKLTALLALLRGTN